MVVGIAYIWCNEWQEIETLETGNKQINNFRKEINEIQIHLIEFSLLGETVLDWNDDDLLSYPAFGNGQYAVSFQNYLPGRTY